MGVSHITGQHNYVCLFDVVFGNFFAADIEYIYSEFSIFHINHFIGLV